MSTSARITAEFLLSVAPRQSWLNTRQAAGFKPTSFFVRRWIGLKKLRRSARRGMTTRCYGGIPAHELSSETSSFRVRKKNQSNFRLSNCSRFVVRSEFVLERPRDGFASTKTPKDKFTRFEHAGWERVADKYDSTWSSLTRQFIPNLISAAQISSGMSVLDVACGPGYVSNAVKQSGAVPTGIDFSEKMIAIANAMF